MTRVRFNGARRRQLLRRQRAPSPGPTMTLAGCHSDSDSGGQLRLTQQAMSKVCRSRDRGSSESGLWPRPWRRPERPQAAWQGLAWLVHRGQGSSKSSSSSSSNVPLRSDRSPWGRLDPETRRSLPESEFESGRCGPAPPRCSTGQRTASASSKQAGLRRLYLS